MWHFIQMVESSNGLSSEREENSQSDEGVSDKRLSVEKGGSTLLKENVCQVGVLKLVHTKKDKIMITILESTPRDNNSYVICHFKCLSLLKSH